MPSSWPDEKNALVDALICVISSVLALRSCVRFLLRRRRGVNVGRHAFGLKDLARSVAYSLTQTSARNQGLVVAFAAAVCLLYTSPSPRDRTRSRMPSSA